MDDGSIDDLFNDLLNDLLDGDNYLEEDEEWRTVAPMIIRSLVVTREPPTSFRRWDDSVSSTGDPGDWPHPRQKLDDGRWWLELVDCEDWLHIGHAPMPKTPWQRFWHHWHHGRLMGYRPIDVLSYALRISTGHLKPVYDPPKHQRKASK